MLRLDSWDGWRGICLSLADQLGRDLTDAQGSVLTSLSASAVLGEQTYGPYGNQRYNQGSMGIDKGYTGQFHDAVSGLDYYNARYYDPVVGAFLSPDSVQGNAQGMSPYLYVAGNPETLTDPTRQMSCDAFGQISMANLVVHTIQLG